MKRVEFRPLKLVSQFVRERVHYGLFLSRPPFNNRILSWNRLVFRFEPVGYDNCSEQFLDSYSSGSSLFHKKSVGLFAEGHHDLIRRFSTRSQVFEYPNGPFEYLYCKYEGARHIRITEDPPRNSPRIPKATLRPPIAFIPEAEGSIISCRGLFRAACARENSP